MATNNPTPSDLDDEIAAKRTELAELQRQAREVRERDKPEPKRIRSTKTTVRALPVPRDRMVIFWDKETTAPDHLRLPRGSDRVQHQGSRRSISPLQAR